MKAAAERKTKTAPAWLARWGPVLAWLSMIFVLSDQPDFGPPGLDVPGLDKLAHVVEYAILGLLLRRAGRVSRQAGWGGMMGLCALGGLLWACTDELHQARVPGREGDWRDLLADAAGLVLGLGLGAVRRRRAARRANHA